MTVRKYSSRAQQSTLASSLAAGATTMTLASGGGAKVMGGKTLTGSQTYTLVIDPDTSLEEIVDVTVYSSGDTLTITRARDGSTDVAHSAGAVVRHMVIGRDLQEANDHIEASAAVHGLSGTVVGTSDTQTLTNKTLTAPTVSGATISGTVTSTATITGGTVNPTTLQQGGVQAVTTTGSQTLTNKTLTTPTIADFSNATHDHTNSAGGGALSTSAISGIQEYIEDTVGAMVSSNTESGIAVTYDDATGKLNFNVDDPTITLDGDITGSATMTNLGNTTITTAISSGSIVNADINASAGIAYSKLSLNSSITSADLVDGTIVNADINASANIALSKLATDPLARANHTGTQTASTISDFDTQVRTSKVTDLAAPTGSFSMNSQKITSLGTPTTSTDAATKGYIDTEITNLINGAPGTLDTLKEIADEIQAGGTFYDAVVFKSGSTMTGALTLHADPSANLQAATKQYVDTVAGSATAAAASAAAAAASYDSFDDRYLGAKSSAPTLDNDGNALIEGALYWNSVDNAMYAWDATGSAWGSISSTAAIYRYKFVASGGETSVSGTDANGLTLSYLAGKEQVYLNGVLLVRGSDYTASNGTSITSLAALAASDVLEIITFTAFDLATAIANTVFDAKGDLLVASAADTVGKLSVGTNGYYLKANSGAALGVEWAAVDALPSQTGNAGEFLTTDGSTASWAAVDAVPLTTINAKGDLLAGTADNAVTRVAVGANDTVLTADSSTASGVKWAAVSGGKGVLFTVASGATADTYTGTYSFASGSYFIPYFSNVLSSTVGGQTITSGNSLTTLTTAQTSVSIVPNRSWTERSGISTNTAYALAYGAGLWVMGQSNAALGTSTDLITWTSRDSKFAGSDIFNGHYANGYFVIVGGTGRCSTSTDGITWTSRGINFGTTAVYGITYGTQWVAVGNTGKISYTTDVTNQWSAAAAMGTSTWNSVAYGNSVYVAVGGAGVAMSSTDGITWTTRSSGTGNNLRDIIYGDKFVAVGDSSTIHTSTNGITWTARTSPASQDWGQVIYGNGAYIIGGYNGAAAGSTDGITWTTRNINIGAVGTYGGFFGNNTYVFGTGNGRSTSASTANLGYGASTSVGYVLYQPTDSVTAI